MHTFCSAYTEHVNACIQVVHIYIELIIEADVVHAFGANHLA